MIKDYKQNDSTELPKVKLNLEMRQTGEDGVSETVLYSDREQPATPESDVSDAGKDGDGTGKYSTGSDEDRGQTLSEVINEQAKEGEEPQSTTFTLRKILGGDILNTAIIRKQIWLLLLIACFVIIYITNRYSCQQDLIEIDKLTRELQDAKYRALSTSSQLTEMGRESHVLEVLSQNKDSVLHIPMQPPYIINVPEEDNE